MLAWTIYLSFLGLAVLMCLPKDRPALARPAHLTLQLKPSITQT
jgi:hypothetical protein